MGRNFRYIGGLRLCESYELPIRGKFVKWCVFGIVLFIYIRHLTFHIYEHLSQIISQACESVCRNEVGTSLFFFNLPPNNDQLTEPSDVTVIYRRVVCDVNSWFSLSFCIVCIIFYCEFWVYTSVSMSKSHFEEDLISIL